MVLLFTDGKDLVGVKRSLDIKYMRFLQLGLNILQCWPHIKGELESKYAFLGKIYIFGISVVCLLGGMGYLVHNVGKIAFIKLGHTYITVSMNMVVLTRVSHIFLKKYTDLVNYFVNKIHLFNHKDRSEYAKKTHILVHKVSHFTTVSLYGAMIFVIFCFNGTPFYNNLMSGAFDEYKRGNITFEHSVYYYIPTRYEDNIYVYITLFIMNWYISLICGFTFMAFDLLMCVMIFHVSGNFQILINMLENLNELFRLETRNNKTKQIFSVEESHKVHKELKEIIKYHQLIIDFTAKLSSTFGLVLLQYYIFHSVSLCILLLKCSEFDPEVLTRYGILTFMVIEQLVLISVAFELLGTMSYKLVKAVYGVPWECMNISQRKMVHIMLMQSQKRVTVKAMDMVTVGVETMAAILKTSLSYFVMLQTFTTEEVK